jgi:23S rRNA-/tRNA-specific pseudouridylate synthase
VIAILAEDDRCLWVAKPAGLPVFPPHADPGGDCVLARLLEARPEQREPAFPAGFEGGIAHRLDNPTSGALLVARSVEALAEARVSFAEKRLRKDYLFVSAREVPWDRHEVRVELAHDARRHDRMIARRGADTPHRGRWFPAETLLSREGRTPMGGLWRATITTGVMHQIRVHAASVGLALRGDRIYGGGAPISRDELPDLPDGVPFLLHHLGAVGGGLPAARCPRPGWWPAGGAGAPRPGPR